jgi:ATP-binding cassette subfamily B protein
MPMVLIINSTVFLGILLFALMLVDSNSTIIISLTLFLFYYIISRGTKAKIAKSSLIVSIGLDSLFKYLRESYGGIRDIIIDGREANQIQRYIKIESDLRGAQASIALISQVPKVIIEAFVMIAMILYSYHAIGQDGGVGVIATIAASAYVIQKVLPLIQQAYNGLVSFRGNLDVAYDVLAALNSQLSTDKDLRDFTRLPISRSIEFRNVGFKYSTSDKFVLNDINVKFEKGFVYGVCGESGEGKSTLVDILMGLLYPTSGEVLIDGLVLERRDLRLWRKNISHVPQSAFLMDDTIINNICLADPVNIPDIDRVNYSIDLAQLRDFVNILPDGVNAEIGEQGCSMSGGQRQRISIARAIYKNSEVVVLDEPTSALDFETANQVIDSIISLKTGRVIVVVSHDYNILKRCDRLLKIKGGVVQIN